MLDKVVREGDKVVLRDTAFPKNIINVLNPPQYSMTAQHQLKVVGKGICIADDISQIFSQTLFDFNFPGFDTKGSFKLSFSGQQANKLSEIVTINGVTNKVILKGTQLKCTFQIISPAMNAQGVPYVPPLTLINDAVEFKLLDESIFVKFT
jgi:hypothetical protein